MYDLMITNGHVIDPQNGIDEVKTVAVKNNKIVSYDDSEAPKAKIIVDAKDKYVFPGLIDAHAHMFVDGTDIGFNPDTVYLPTGVTSAIDFSPGVSNFALFKRAVIDQSIVRIKCFLQVCSAGLVTTSYHECLNPKYFNKDKMAQLLDSYADTITGLKIRLSEDLVDGLGIAPLLETIKIAEELGCPVQVHCTNLPVPSAEVLGVLRKGDIFQHVYQGVQNTILDEHGKVYDSVWDARERGIIFDSAEGRKHGDFDVMQKSLAQGFVADICSTDLVKASVFRRPIFSLPNLMSRYVAMGIPLTDVVRMTTETPAKLMGLTDKIGCLSPGAYADIAIFNAVDCPQTYRDWKGSQFESTYLLKPEMTIKNGQIYYCAPDFIFE